MIQSIPMSALMHTCSYKGLELESELLKGHVKGDTRSLDYGSHINIDPLNWRILHATGLCGLSPQRSVV